MKVVKRTPRSEIVARILWKRVEGLAPQLAEALDLPVEAVQTALNTYVYIITNVEFEQSDIAWQPACATDDEAVIAAKFLEYMGADLEPIDRATALVQARDRPFDAATAPETPEGTEKNS